MADRQKERPWNRWNEPDRPIGGVREIVYDWSRPTYNRSAAMTTVNIQRRRARPLVPLRRKGDPKHGTYAAYLHGCGCEPCRTANRNKSRQRRAG